MAVTTRVGAPTLDEVVARAEALLPRLRERARTAEVERHVPTETVQELRDAGLFRVLQPASYGGYELDYGRTQVELCHVLGQACGSTAWVQCVVACHAWCLAMFPPAAQEAVWGRDQDTLIASAFGFDVCSHRGFGRVAGTAVAHPQPRPLRRGARHHDFDNDPGHLAAASRGLQEQHRAYS